MSRSFYTLAVSFLLTGCSAEPIENASAVRNILEGSGWSVEQSPYMLKPGTTISVCDKGVKSGVADLVVKAARIWLDKGGRDERIQVSEGCDGDRIIQLTKAPSNVSYYGQAHPLKNKIHALDVPDKWAGKYTSNHEVGHVFGFAHIFQSTVSIMNSEGNGKYMNNGDLSEYDEKEIKSLLAREEFTEVNSAWSSKSSEKSSNKSSESKKSEEKNSDVSDAKKPRSKSNSSSNSDEELENT